MPADAPLMSPTTTPTTAATTTGPVATPSGSGRLFAAALDQSSQPICIAPAPVPGAPAVVVSANPSYLELFCAEAADVVGRVPGWVVGPLSEGRVGEGFAECARSGRPQRLRTIEYRLDGGVFRARWRLDPVVTDGSVTHVVATPQDVSLEHRRRRRLEALEAWTACLDASPAERALEATRDALAAAVAIVVDDLGDGTVQLTGLPSAVHRRSTVTRPAGTVPTTTTTDASRAVRWYGVGPFGTIGVALVPGARALFDHHLLRTLAERSARSLGSAGGRPPGAPAW